MRKSRSSSSCRGPSPGQSEVAQPSRLLPSRRAARRPRSRARCGSSRLRRSANTMPVAPSASTTTGRTHTSRLDARVLGREQDRLAVACRRRPGGSSVVALARRDATLDVGADRARRRRLAVGHRETLALRALQLGLELVRAVGRRLRAARPAARPRARPRRPRRARSTGPSGGSPGVLGPRRGSARAPSATSDRTSRAATIPLGEIAYVSGCPRVPKSSAATEPGSSAIVHVDAVLLHVCPHFVGGVVADDADHREVGVVLVLRRRTSASAGASCWHGMHHEFQKLTITDLPGDVGERDPACRRGPGRSNVGRGLADELALLGVFAAGRCRR